MAEAIAAVRRAPRAFALVHGHYRRVVVRHFPYVVVYAHDDAAGTVTVYAVFHTSRDPDSLLGRLP